MKTRPLQTGNLASKPPGDSKHAVLHCGGESPDSSGSRMCAMSSEVESSPEPLGDIQHEFLHCERRSLSQGSGDESPDSSESRRRMCGMSGEVGIQKSCTSPRMSGRYLRTCWRRKETSSVSCWNRNSLRVSSLPLITPNRTGITCSHDSHT